jgi:hypothetical protein
MRAFYAAGITRDRTPENPAAWCPWRVIQIPVLLIPLSIAGLY